MLFRDFLTALQEADLLRQVDEEVDWKFEVGAMLALTYRVEGPALLFSRISGYGPEHKMVGALYAGTREVPWSKMAIGLGLPRDLTYDQWSEVWEARLRHRIKPVVVKNGPCKEEIHRGEDVDVLEFPLPYLHIGDGGRYGGSLSVVFTRHPTRDWTNVGNYRWMAHTRSCLGGDFQPGQQMADMFFEYERRGEPMPFCIALGVPPALDLAAAVPLPVGVNEVEVAGGLQEEPLRMVSAETCDILVPADAEIILEGEVLPRDRWYEGPVGEFDGFVAGPRRVHPVYRVKAITHRRDPIFPVVNEGFRFGDTAAMGSSIWSLVLKQKLIDAGIAARLYCLPEACWAIPIVQPLDRPDHIGSLIATMWSVPHMAWVDKLILMDPDVDVTDSAAVLEELVMRATPERVYAGKPSKPISVVESWASADDMAAGVAPSLNYDCTTLPGASAPERMQLANLCRPDLLAGAAALLETC